MKGSIRLAKSLMDSQSTQTSLMDRIKKHLDKLDDYELVVFLEHRFEEYMKATQEKLKYYVKYERGLDQDQVKKLLSQKPKMNPKTKHLHCPECHSMKLVQTEVKWQIPAFRVGYEDEMAAWKEITTGQATYKTKIECFVCGHVIFDPNNEKRSWWKRILDVFFDQPLPV